jgi:HSP20 family molecular chaperone IbpA
MYYDFKVDWSDLADTINSLFEENELLDKWKKDNDGYYLEVPAIKVKKEDISLDIVDNSVKMEWVNKYGVRFGRTYPLPKDADKSSITAKLEDGMLEIRIAVKPKETTKIVIS